MSTLPGRPLGQIGPSAHEAQDARDNSTAEAHAAESGGETFVSPYAPKRSRRSRRPDANRRLGEDSPGEVPSSANPPEASRSDRPAGDAQTAGPGGSAERRSNDLHRAPPLQPPDSVTGRANEPSEAEPRKTALFDEDLDRLEASLRWLQRTEGTAHLPRAAPLPRVPGLAPVDSPLGSKSAEPLGGGSRLPRSLEPERMAPPPPTSRRDTFWVVLCMIIAFIFVAAFSYYLATGWDITAEAPAGQQLVSAETIVPRAPATSSLQQGPASAKTVGSSIASSLGAISARDDQPAAEQNEPSSGEEEVRPERSSDRETLAMLQPTQPQPSAPPPVAQEPAAVKQPAIVKEPAPKEPVRVLDPEEIKLLLKQGEQFIAAGDVVTARLVLQRAAEAGDATAAIALGATFDPNVLARLGVLGVEPDVEKARKWYEKAESFGSAEATRRLRMLAAR